jgi:hypothetical protein
VKALAVQTLNTCSITNLKYKQFRNSRMTWLSIILQIRKCKVIDSVNTEGFNCNAIEKVKLPFQHYSLNAQTRVARK